MTGGTSDQVLEFGIVEVKNGVVSDALTEGLIGEMMVYDRERRMGCIKRVTH